MGSRAQGAVALARARLRRPESALAARRPRGERSSALHLTRSVETRLVRGEEIAARDDAHEAMRLLSLYHGEPPDLLRHHLIGGVAQRVVVEHDDGRARDRRGDGLSAVDPGIRRARGA